MVKKDYINLTKVQTTVGWVHVKDSYDNFEVAVGQALHAERFVKCEKFIFNDDSSIATSINPVHIVRFEKCQELEDGINKGSN